MTEFTWYMLLVSTGAIAGVVLLSCGRRNTMGLPLAYILALALIHLPGGFAYAASGGEYTGLLAGGDYPAIGMGLTAVAMCSFLTGLLMIRQFARGPVTKATPRNARPDQRSFMLFCVVAGWIAAFGATPLTAIPTLGAAIVFGSAIWMLGVILGLRQAIAMRRTSSFLLWLGALLVYPVTILTLGGFLSYGSTAVIIVLASILARFRRVGLVLLSLPIAFTAGISVFVNYFEDRDALRGVVWSGAGVEDRIDAVASTFSDFKLFDAQDSSHLEALAQRLNQNEFVGLAHERLQNGEVAFLAGRSFFEGLISIVPRALWPDKPVYGGSPAVVSEMTGLQLSQTTSWGVGNVMEFYINFGYWSLIPAFVLLGALIGWLDRKSAQHLSAGSLDRTLLYFLPGVALIQPNGSMVELVAGAFAALLAAHFWVQLWNFLQGRRALVVRSRASARPLRR